MYLRATLDHHIKFWPIAVSALLLLASPAWPRDLSMTNSRNIRVALGQPAQLLIGQLPASKIFNPPQSSANDRFVTLSDLDTVQVFDSVDSDIEIVLSAVESGGASVTIIFDYQPDPSQVARVNRVQFRPGPSNNSASSAASTALKVITAFQAQPSCKVGEVTGSSRGLSLVKKYGWDWPVVELEQALKDQDSGSIVLEQAVTCGKLKGALEVRQKLHSARGTPGFDVLFTAWSA